MKGKLGASDDILATLCLATVIILTGTNVLTRYIFKAPVAWTMELVLALFIWFVFIGVSSSMKRDGHIGVDFFVKKLPKSLRIISLVIRAVGIYFVLIYVFVYLGTLLSLQSTGKVTPIIGLEYFYIDIAVPLGGIFTTVHFTRSLVRSFQAEVGSKGE